MGRVQASARAFTLVELLIVIAVLALLIGILLPGLHGAQRTTRSAVCLSNLRQHATGTSSYAADFADRIWTFSWRAGHNAGSEFGPAPDAVQAARDQAISILRRRADRTDIPRNTGGWLPHLMYSHLALLEYLDHHPLSAIAACPEDTLRRRVQSDVAGFTAGVYQPSPTAITWPYSSSYHLTASAFDRLQSRSIRTNSSRRISSGWYFGQFLVPTNADVGPPRISDVSFPASKVHLHELLQRHEGPPGAQWLYALPDSITAMLRFDGSAGFAIGRDLNRGWHPHTPSVTAPPAMYVPEPWEGRARSPAGDIIYERQRWTRGGLRGIDLGGSEVNTGQWP